MQETRLADELDTTKTQSEAACDVTWRSGGETVRDDSSCRGHPEGHSDDGETFSEEVLMLAEAMTLCDRKTVIKTYSETHEERIDSTRSRNHCRDKHAQKHDM